MESIRNIDAPYLGNIPIDWLFKKVKYVLKRSLEKGHPFEVVLSLYRDYGVLPKDSRDDNHNVTGEDTSKYLFVRTGNFVINKMKAWQGSMAVSKYNGIVSPAYYVYIFIDNTINKEYFHYLLRNKSYTPEFRRLSGGIREGQWDLSEQAFGNVLICIPPLEEQKKIADFLDDKCAQIDEITKVLEKKISKLEQYKKVLIKDAVTKGIDGAKLVDSGIDWIGKIPEHWRLIPNKYLFVETTDKVGKLWASYDLLSLTTSGVKIKDINNIGGKMPDNYEKYLIIKKGQMIFCLFDLDMSAVFAGIATADGMITSAYNAYNATDLIDTRFANYFFQFVFINRTYKLYSKNIRYTVTTDVFNSIKTAVPPLEEQKKIADFLDDKYAQIDEITKATREEIETLKQYKQSLIYEYVTGKKEVPNE